MNSRLIAVRVLNKVFQNGQSLTAALDDALSGNPSEGIEPKDKAFIQALCYGVCRQSYRLEVILNELLDKPLKDLEVKALALVGLYQLEFMRVKPHAAVSETVQAARKKPWAKALLNALLRNYLRKQDALTQKANSLQVAATSHPEWLIKRIEQDWPEQAPDIFMENNLQAPLVLRVNESKISKTDYLTRLEEQGIIAAAVDFCASAIVIEKPVQVESLPGFSSGLVSVQDSAAQLAAGLLDVLPGQRVLDVCAAPGGKAAHILESQPGLKELVAVDIDASRMQRVRQNLDRLALSASLLVGDASQPTSWWDGRQFERILLDVPCSAIGVIRRHPDIKILRRDEDIQQLIVLQKKILQAIWPLLAPGGVLLYATCSILRQENEWQVAAFIESHPDAVSLPIHADWGLPVSYGRQIITGESSMDGFYYALLGKR